MKMYGIRILRVLLDLVRDYEKNWTEFSEIKGVTLSKNRRFSHNFNTFYWSYSRKRFRKNPVFGPNWRWILYVILNGFSFQYCRFWTVISTCGFGFLFFFGDVFSSIFRHFQRFLEWFFLILTSHSRWVFQIWFSKTDIWLQKKKFLLENLFIFRLCRKLIFTR